MKALNCKSMKAAVLISAIVFAAGIVLQIPAMTSLFDAIYFEIIMAFLGLDMISSFASVAACIFNVGPGLGLVGPVDNYLTIPLIGKWVLIFCMLLGRLEIYTVIVLLTPECWRK